ncbi:MULTISPECIES: DNA topoisomerase [Rhodococcus erythropolis group]|uniref:DNA topoisomerase III n=1 Tax=Rhodococcus erythropolis TaxID=1833 RepID=A0A8I0ZR13_RHOER|nr:MULTISPECIES: DNA topoisomerase [Rhodococcus erythropolis group]MBH5144229.1 DNA topoisomerase III [Rhodococcus erythropolis]MDJ0434685.1 DNA topoisomerase [Rhodococcus qingshengii]
MGKVGILTEKPSAAGKFAAALGGMSGTFEGTEYVIVHASGHLLELKDPAAMVPAPLSEKYKSWDLAYLPWNAADFRWEREVRRKVSGKKLVTDPGAERLLGNLQETLSTCETVCNAADLDPTGEGSLLGWEIVEYLGLEGKKLERMEFLDETPPSLRKAFLNRRPVTSIESEGDYRKADFRSKWDMLSMQFTRAATKLSGSDIVVRNGRLKSAMVVIVGDGLDAHQGYVKKPFYENRFRDENGVTYTDPEIDRFENRSEVPGGLEPSPVVHDGTTRKKTGPPKLIDLAALSSLLSKKGFAAKKVLETYQKMYEAEVVSYPRTEDKFISIEQFNELLPLVDKIAAVVGVDPAALSHRGPRKTHIKSGGAHGANRPGPNVPQSLADVAEKFGELGKEIYELLSKNYLTMLAPDYEYDQHRGHVAKYPSFVGSLNVPAVLGWKGVFVIEDDEPDDEDAPSGAQALGTLAKPFVHEGFPARPPHPTMGWLMKQLEKRRVGTASTLTSTYAEVTNNATGKALMIEKRGKITLSVLGELNHRILPGTRIGDLSITEKVFEQMAQIETGAAAAPDFLALVEDLVRHDLEKMKANVTRLPAELKERMAKAGVTRAQVENITLPPALHFTHGDAVATTAKRVFCGHRFTDSEVAALLAGQIIEITAISPKSGKPFTCKGTLEAGVTEKGYPFVGFKPQFEERPPRTDLVSGVWKDKKVQFKGRGWGANEHWAGKDFTEQELAKLLAGETIEFEAIGKTGKKYTAKGALAVSTHNGYKNFGFTLKFDNRTPATKPRKRKVSR